MTVQWSFQLKWSEIRIDDFIKFPGGEVASVDSLGNGAGGLCVADDF
jgi:hypothetical protein